MDIVTDIIRQQICHHRRPGSGPKEHAHSSLGPLRWLLLRWLPWLLLPWLCLCLSVPVCPCCKSVAVCACVCVYVPAPVYLRLGLSLVLRPLVCLPQSPLRLRQLTLRHPGGRRRSISCFPPFSCFFRPFSCFFRPGLVLPGMRRTSG